MLGMSSAEAQDFAAQRSRMVAEIEAEAVLTASYTGKVVFRRPVMEAIARVPRHEFVPVELQPFAYLNRPLPIGFDTTISQPYIVALMAEALEIGPGQCILEVGAGSGYAAAVLSRIADEVYAIERHARLADLARERMRRLGYWNVHIQHGDGTLGWPEHAPYDAIAVAAGGPEVPPALQQQLAIGGRLVIPVGGRDEQLLLRLTRHGDEIRAERLSSVRFVPLIGAHAWEPGDDTQSIASDDA